MGIENDTWQKEGKPYHKGTPHTNIGIENDTQHARDKIFVHIGIENDTRQIKEF